MKSSLIFIFLFTLFKPDLKANSGNYSPVLYNTISSRNTLILDVKDKSDKTIIIWEDKSTTRNINTQIFAQRIDKTGASLWGKAVELTCDSNRVQNSHQLISDGKGGVIITWEERSFESEETHVYAQHIDSLGIKLWGQRGKILTSATGSQISPMIASDGSGGAIIAWTDSRNDLTYNNWDIYAQHLTSDGEPAWEKDGLLISTDVKDEYLGKVLSGPDGGVTIVWNKVITSFSNDTEGYEFHFRKLNFKGETIQSLNSENFLTLPASNINYALGTDILSDTRDGFFLSLTMNSNQLDTGLYLQHVLASGDLAFMGSYGLLIDSSIPDSKSLNIETDTLGNILVQWLKRDSTFIVANSMKFDISGNKLLLDSYFDEAGELQNVYNFKDTLFKENILADTNSPLLRPKFLVNNRKRNRTLKEIHQKVNNFNHPNSEKPTKVQDIILKKDINLISLNSISSKTTYTSTTQNEKSTNLISIQRQPNFNLGNYVLRIKDLIISPNFYTGLQLASPGYHYREQNNQNSKAILYSLYSLASSG